MRICCISDLHGQLPEIPESDLLIIAGDICPLENHNPIFQGHWLRETFGNWMDSLPVKKVVACWGNHDLIGETRSMHLVPRLKWELLTDQNYTYEGLNIWGSPWQLRFFDWAFNLDKDLLDRKYDRMPDGIHILVTHGPPYGFGDLAPPYEERKNWEHVGSATLTKRILEIKPVLTVTGHIHSGYGVYAPTEHPEIVIANASVVNEHYDLVNKPLLFDWEDGKITSQEPIRLK
jgi:Icc-related predicted phosphoesterase